MMMVAGWRRGENHIQPDVSWHAASQVTWRQYELAIIKRAGCPLLSMLTSFAQAVYQVTSPPPATTNLGLDIEATMPGTHHETLQLCVAVDFGTTYTGKQPLTWASCLVQNECWG